MQITRAVAEWIVHTPAADIPAEALQAAARSCFDLIGDIVAGTLDPVSKTVRAYATEQGGSATATLIGTRTRIPAASAAFANGTQAHALDFDDSGGFGHPTAVLLPGLLAAAELRGATGKEVLEAYVIGCEVGLRLREVTGFDQFALGFHSTAALGRMAATAACARLLKLDVQQTIWALGMAGSMASGVLHNFGSMAKPFHAGMACRDGVTAAELALRGVTAGPSILEHPLGFVGTVCKKPGLDVSALASNLGRPFRTHLALQIKKYPSCLCNHSSLDSVLTLIRRHGFGPADVEEVRAAQEPRSPVLMFGVPHDAEQARFSLLYNLAAAIVDEAVTLETFTESRLGAPAIHEMMKRVHIDRLEGPDGTRSGHVHVRLRDGRVLDHNTHEEDVLGSPKNPWPVEEVTRKFEKNCSLVLSPRAVSAAVTTWRDLREVNDVRRALEGLCP